MTMTSVAAEPPLRALQAVESDLWWLAVSEVGLPALASRRQPHLAALGAPGDEGGALGAHVRQFTKEPSRAPIGKESLMLLWLLVFALIIFAIAGGVAVSNFLWLVLIVALVVAVVALLSGRSAA
jgi:hypothetical protein